MTQRDSLIVLIGVLVVAALSAVLFSSEIVAARPPEGRPRVVLQRSPLPPRPPIAELERRIPPESRFLVPFVGVQREMSEATRAGQGLLLLLLLTAGTLVVARDQVGRAYAASAGGWPRQARVLGIGTGVLILVASIAVLAWSFSLGLLASSPRGFFPVGLQLQLAVLGVAVLALAAVALLGFCAAAWRLGALILDIPALRRFAERVPAPVATLLGAALLYAVTQVPYVGPFAALLVLAYSLGTFVITRLAPRP